MRAMLINRAPPSAGKGTERFLTMFGNFLSARGWEITYLCDAIFNGPRLNVGPRPLFSLIEARFRRWGPFYEVPAAIVRRFRPDLVYLNPFVQFPTFPLLDLPTILGTTTFGPERAHRGHEAEGPYVKLEEAMLRSWYGFTYPPRRSLVHCLNPEQATWFSVPRRRRIPTLVVPLPVDGKVFYPRRSEWRTDPPFQLLFVGGIDERKGIRPFVRIAERVHERYPGRVEALVVGDGLDRPFVVERAARRPFLRYVGVVDDVEKAALYARANLLVSPSLEENFHYVTAEAQVCGLPVLSSDLSGPRSIIRAGETGWLVPRGDEDAFERMIVGCCENYFADAGAYRSLRDRTARAAEPLADLSPLVTLEASARALAA
jgi:glycosyltransferase involved in cell wall biosynthesis